MTQFIQYLYEYENGQRVRNLGFMKVEKQMDKTVIQIYAKQLDEVTGVQFQRENGSRYVATWGDEQACECEPEQTEAVQQPVEQPTVTQYPLPEEPEMAQTIQEFTEQPASTKGQQQEEEISEYIPPSSRRCEKIQRQDLSRLPRREWRLANNSFLLHGFYNYHHLLYIEDGEQVWIGVPGIYHEKEKAAANAFGFPKFQRLTDMEIELSEEEKNTYEDFGYWCRQIER